MAQFKCGNYHLHKLPQAFRQSILTFCSNSILNFNCQGKVDVVHIQEDHVDPVGHLRKGSFLTNTAKSGFKHVCQWIIKDLVI